VARRVTVLSPQHNSAWNLLGISLLALNQLEAAASALEAQIKIDPGSPIAYNNLGRVYWRQHKYEDAAAQFRKQIVINPQDHYAHANLGMLLRDEKKCGEALPELDRALAITPNKAEALLAQGECDIDLGNRAKGLSELEQATSVSSSAGAWNSAAYNLAKRNIELERAEKWSEAALTMESARLHSISLEHLTAEQLNFVFSMAHYWDTRGWIYFLRGDNSSAQAYTEACWWLLPDPVIGDHLGQIYEKAGKTEKAVRTYAMAVASAERRTRTNIDPDDVEEARERLAKVAGAKADLAALVERGRVDLAGMTSLSLLNAAKSKGSGEFILKVAAGGKLLQVHEMSGDSAMVKVADSLQAEQLPFRVPESAAVEIPLRGTLTCEAGADRCRFVLLNSEAAFDLASQEAALDSTSSENATVDAHIYNNPVIGIRISLPDEWKLLKEEPGSFSLPHTAMFGKPGSVAFFILARQHLEATPELYQHMIESSLSQQPEYKHNATEKMKRDGFSGTRWSISWADKGGVAYSSVMEFFSVGDEHYRVTAIAPQRDLRSLCGNLRKHVPVGSISYAAYRSENAGRREVMFWQL
jgi:tetratricopeptide (TPR) repeat protein